MLATLAIQGSTFLTTIALARILSAEDFGAYAAVLSTGQIATLVACAGMGYTATRYVAEFAQKDPERASRIFGFCLAYAAAAAFVLGGVIALGAPAMAEHFFHAPALAEPLRLAGGICWFMTVNAVLTGALAGLGSFRALGLVGAVSGPLYFVVTIGCTYQWGVVGTAGGLMASAALQTIALTLVLRTVAANSGFTPDVRHASAERAVLRKFAVPAALAGLTTAASLWLGQLILTREAGLAEIGLYTVAANLLTITMLTPSVANTVGMAMLNKAKGAGDETQFKRVFGANLAISLGLAATVAALIALFGQRILLVFGPGFLMAYPALLALLLAAIPESLGLAYYQLLQSREHMWQAMRLVMLPRDLALPLIALALVPSMGALGLALAYLASRTLYLLTTVYATRRPGP